MSYFANNIKLLRKRKLLSQDAVAKDLQLTRSSLSGYENSTAQAPYDVLIKLSVFYNISIDVILKKDLSKIPSKSISNMEQNGNYDIHGNQLRTLVTSTTDNTESNAELVPIQAIGVYNSNLNDPDFIKDLPLMKLPFLSDNKKYRAFPVIDDSMAPAIKGSYIVGEYFTNWSNIEDGEFYIVVSESKGVIFKQLFNNDPELKSFQLCSNNPVYEPFDIKISDIQEIWKFESYISTTFQENNNSHDHLIFTVKELQRKINNIEKHLKF
jgi:transcriptional regulator with XRE-family HTH domain